MHDITGHTDIYACNYSMNYKWRTYDMWYSHYSCLSFVVFVSLLPCKKLHKIGCNIMSDHEFLCTQWLEKIAVNSWYVHDSGWIARFLVPHFPMQSELLHMIVILLTIVYTPYYFAMKSTYLTHFALWLAFQLCLASPTEIFIGAVFSHVADAGLFLQYEFSEWTKHIRPHGLLFHRILVHDSHHSLSMEPIWVTMYINHVQTHYKEKKNKKKKRKKEKREIKIVVEKGAWFDYIPWPF